jgi:hypothetical protein
MKTIKSMINFIVTYRKNILQCIIPTIVLIIIVGGTVWLELSSPAPRTISIKSFKGEVRSSDEVDTWKMNIVTSNASLYRAMKWDHDAFIVYDSWSFSGRYFGIYSLCPGMPATFQCVTQKFTWPNLWTTACIDYDQQRGNLYVYPGLYDILWIIIVVGALIHIGGIMDGIDNFIKRIKEEKKANAPKGKSRRIIRLQWREKAKRRKLESWMRKNELSPGHISDARIKRLDEKVKKLQSKLEHLGARPIV